MGTHTFYFVGIGMRDACVRYNTRKAGNIVYRCGRVSECVCDRSWCRYMLPQIWLRYLIQPFVRLSFLPSSFSRQRTESRRVPPLTRNYIINIVLFCCISNTMRYSLQNLSAPDANASQFLYASREEASHKIPTHDSYKNFPDQISWNGRNGLLEVSYCLDMTSICRSFDLHIWNVTKSEFDRILNVQ